MATAIYRICRLYVCKYNSAHIYKCVNVAATSQAVLVQEVVGTYVAVEIKMSCTHWPTDKLHLTAIAQLLPLTTPFVCPPQRHHVAELWI